MSRKDNWEESPDKGGASTPHRKNDITEPRSLRKNQSSEEPSIEEKRIKSQEEREQWLNPLLENVLRENEKKRQAEERIIVNQEVRPKLESLLEKFPLKAVVQSMTEIMWCSWQKKQYDLLEETRDLLNRLPEIIGAYVKEPDKTKYAYSALSALSKKLLETGFIRKIAPRIETYALANELELIAQTLSASLENNLSRLDRISEAAGYVTERLSDVRKQATGVKQR